MRITGEQEKRRKEAKQNRKLTFSSTVYAFPFAVAEPDIWSVVRRIPPISRLLSAVRLCTPLISFYEHCTANGTVRYFASRAWRYLHQPRDRHPAASISHSTFLLWTGGLSSLYFVGASLVKHLASSSIGSFLVPVLVAVGFAWLLPMLSGRCLVCLECLVNGSFDAVVWHGLLSTMLQCPAPAKLPARPTAAINNGAQVRRANRYKNM